MTRFELIVPRAGSAPTTDGILHFKYISARVLRERSKHLTTDTDKSDQLRDWLLYTGRYLEGFELFTKELSATLNLFGFSTTRLNLGVYILHPDIAGVAFQCHENEPGVLGIAVEHEDLKNPIYRQSPICTSVENNEVVRVRICESPTNMGFPVIDDLRDEGFTDYGVCPLPGGSGRTNVWSVATNKDEGFSDVQWNNLHGLSLYLSLVVDYLAVQWLAGVLMQVYLGQRTGQRVLKGQVKRGDGQRIKAALWYCDMRDFTKLSNSMSSEDLILVLNEYFGHVGPAVQAQNGEILKFIGDAMLAIFPIDEDDKSQEEVCAQCLEAALIAQATLAEWSNERVEQGEVSVRSGIGLHIGEVVYGNIGTPGRLDFTVIGEAVNRVARVEGMCSSLGYELLATRDFIDLVSHKEKYLGDFLLKGIEDPVEIFAIDFK